MTGKTARRTVLVKMWSLLAVCLTLLGGLVAWLGFGRDTAAPCNGLAEDEHVRTSVGAGVQAGMNCAALGRALVKATAASEPGKHSQAQARAVKDVLYSPGLGYTENLRIDPALRVPLATVLADYAGDFHEMLAGLDSQYVIKGDPDDDPWESSGTYHLAVGHLVFRNVVRAVSRDPQAYAILRLAETRYAAQLLAAVPGDATGAAFSLPPTENARTLGILDGLTDRYARDQAWRTAVLDHLVHAPADPLTAAWVHGLKDTPQDGLTDRLRAQGIDMARPWIQARITDEPTRQVLLAEVETSALSGFKEITH
ncbi:hypothetical protein ACFWIB_03930 [Streptomyces sp. NPDC127051]|uniref:hypothetical protein n=1 Tax=Streptomyces sp. NPDC127051 TaxID=3347119 RepID=UPI003663458A